MVYNTELLGLQTLSIVPYSKNWKTQCFGADPVFKTLYFLVFRISGD
jgi:hypothetical protein